jgi:hypothetical protein
VGKRPAEAGLEELEVQAQVPQEEGCKRINMKRPAEGPAEELRHNKKMQETNHVLEEELIFTEDEVNALEANDEQEG